MTKQTADTNQIRAAFQANPRKMTMMLARELGVPEAEVMKALPESLSTPLDINLWEDLIRSFEPLGKVHVICSNGAVTLESVGVFGNFSTAGEFFNVQTATLDMHIRYKNLGSAFAVKKPGHMDGVNTLSVQFFDKQGNSAFKVFLTFGGSAPSEERLAHFTGICDKFRLNAK